MRFTQCLCGLKAFIIVCSVHSVECSCQHLNGIISFYVRCQMANENHYSHCETYVWSIPLLVINVWVCEFWIQPFFEHITRNMIYWHLTRTSFHFHFDPVMYSKSMQFLILTRSFLFTFYDFKAHSILRLLLLSSWVHSITTLGTVSFNWSRVKRFDLFRLYQWIQMIFWLSNIKPFWYQRRVNQIISR